MIKLHSTFTYKKQKKKKAKVDKLTTLEPVDVSVLMLRGEREGETNEDFVITTYKLYIAIDNDSIIFTKSDNE